MLIPVFLLLFLFSIYFFFRLDEVEVYYSKLLDEVFKELRLHLRGFKDESLPIEYIPNIAELALKFWIPVSKFPTYEQLKKEKGTIKDIEAYYSSLLIKSILINLKGRDLWQK